MKNTHFGTGVQRALAIALVPMMVACGGGDSASSAGAAIAGPGPTPSPSPSPSPTPSPTPSASPSPTPTPTPTQGTASGRQNQMLAVMLAAHNDARAEVGVPDLVLDQDLSDQALAYAEELARTGRFEHSPGNTRQGQGENLWAGTAGAFSYEVMAAGWIDEKQYYIHAAFPQVSSTGNWADVGHYTQIIWRNTTRLGCGVATGTGRDYLVCRYAPPGNVTGQFAY